MTVRRSMFASLLAVASLAGIGAGPATAPAASPSGRSAHAEVTIISDASTIAPSRAFTVALHFKLDPQWHVYWKDPGDSGMPPSVKWTLPAGFTAGELQFPAPEVMKGPAGTNYVYEGDVALLVQITPPSDFAPDAKTVPITADLKWLECDPDMCLPAKASVGLTLNVGETAVPADTDRFARWQRLVEKGKTFDPKSAAEQAH